MTSKPRRAEGERPRDRFGRPLAWDAESEIELLDYDSLPMDENHDLAIDYFNQELFFPAHEAWEGAWRKAKNTPDEDFFNGLAKLGAGFTHIQRGNAFGARTLITKAIERIEPRAPAHREIDVAALCRDLREIARALEETAEAREAPPVITFPQIRRAP